MKKLALLLITLTLVACNYSKVCRDGFCEITEDGVTRYEGDPEKIAAYKAQKQRLANAQMQRDEKYKQAPRRESNEIIRVGLLKPDGGNQFGKHEKEIYKWLKSEFQGEPLLKIVPEEKIKYYLKLVETKIPVARGWNQDGPREKSVVVPNAKTMQQLRDLGAGIDVLVFTGMSAKTQTGLVGGGKDQGVGLASANRIEYSATVSSIYDYQPYSAAFVGKSASQIDLAGYDKDGDFKSGSIKGNNRNMKLDRPAVQQLVSSLKTTIISTIGPKLPSRKALEGDKKPEEGKPDEPGLTPEGKALMKLMGF